MKYKNPNDWRTENSEEDFEKFKLMRKSGKNRQQRQILQVEQVHKDFPKVRFYDFHKQGKKFALDNYGCELDYDRCKRTPDGYYFSYPKSQKHIVWNPSIFLIEIVNYNRVSTNVRRDYIDWWNFFDGIEYTEFHIMEFNRFGRFSHDIIRETNDKRESIEILKGLM